MRIRVTLDGEEQLYRRLRRLSEEEFIEACKETTTYLRNRARVHTPVKEGKLRNSLRQEMPAHGKDGVVGFTREYAPHVEYGHRQTPGRFVPAIGKRLKARFVQGRYYLKAAVEETRPKFKEILRRKLEE